MSSSSSSKYIKHSVYITLLVCDETRVYREETSHRKISSVVIIQQRPLTGRQSLPNFLL